MGNPQKDILHDMSDRLWTSSSKNDFYLQRGVTLLRDGDCQNALEFFSIATEINPKFAEAYGYIGVAFYVLGLWSEAMDNYQKCPLARFNSGKSLFLSRRASLQAYPLSGSG